MRHADVHERAQQASLRVFIRRQAYIRILRLFPEQFPDQKNPALCLRHINPRFLVPDGFQHNSCRAPSHVFEIGLTERSSGLQARARRERPLQRQNGLLVASPAGGQGSCPGSTQTDGHRALLPVFVVKGPRWQFHCTARPAGGKVRTNPLLGYFFVTCLRVRKCRTIIKL